MSSTPVRRLRPRKPIVRVAFLLAVVVTAWHLFASFLWISPPTPLREVVPGNLLSSYMLPWYGQSWSVFAPEPINGDYNFRVRALVKESDGTEKVTDWVSASEVELTLSTHNLFPPRAAGLAIHQASLLKGVWANLTDDQKKIAELNYFKGDDWLGRMQIAMNESNANANEQAVVRYIVQERYADAYATQVARSIWGDGVFEVQFSATRQNIIPFEQRDDPTAERPPVQYSPTGWRGLIDMPNQSQAHFAETFMPAYANMLGSNEKNK